MAKNIVLCSDGTGQAGGQGFISNVWRIFKAVDRHHGHVDQVAFHADGVGSEQNKYVRAIGGAFGWGLSEDIRKLYASLVRSYEPGDKIFLFGFSRGAFTVRSLAGMIDHIGILKQDEYSTDRELLDAVGEAYRLYRKDSAWADDSQIHDSRKIEFVGVWDTVSAIGVPFDEMRDAIYHISKSIRTPHKHKLNPSIENAYHALSIDDERKTFHPKVWNENKKGFKGNVEQLWFAGVHSNVGGGYPKDSLAFIPLDWMMSKAHGCGLRFLDSKWVANPAMNGFGDYQAQADRNGRIYDSRGGAAIYYRYAPRDIKKLCHGNINGKPRIHESALLRIQSGNTAYAPTAITDDFTSVSTWTDDIQKISGPPDLDAAWRYIGIRRVLYFALLIWTFAFLLTGIFMQDGGGDPCNGGGFCSSTLAFFKSMVPAFLDGWLDSYWFNPFVLAGFIVILGVMGKLRKTFKRNTEEEADLAWRNAQLNSSDDSGPNDPMNKTAPKDSTLSRAKKFSYWGVFILVALFVVARILSIWADSTDDGCATGLFTAKELKIGEQFNIGKNFDVKKAQKNTNTSPPEVHGREKADIFDTKNSCFDTSVHLQAGEKYRIAVMPKGEKWKDKSIPSNPDGFDNWFYNLHPVMILATPLRRHLKDGWFVVMGKIGRHGTTFRVGSEKKIMATETGRLFLYVNDAIPPFCLGGCDFFYMNNTGVAEISVERLAE